MKNRRLVSGLLAAGLAIVGVCGEKNARANDTSRETVKWHPGHYIMVRGAIPDVLYGAFCRTPVAQAVSL